MSASWSEAIGRSVWAQGLLVWPWPVQDWKSVLNRRRLYPIDRKTLASTLHAQNAPYIAQDPALAESLSLLERDTTYTVTAGQQTGWLTGPLYTIYKAVASIQLARTIETRLNPPYRVVPVFWMASEDHDAEEVRWIALNWQTILRYEGHFQGPVGRHQIQKAFPPQADALALQKFYMPGQRWAEAFRATLYALFQGTGLVVLCPDSPALKAMAMDLWVTELSQQLTWQAHAQAAAHLKAHRQKPRLHARPINLFWLSDTERRYIDPTEKAQALRAAHNAPHHLSPNALLRPLYQERILPNLACITGPAEMRYWLELRWAFERFGVFYPVLWPRFSLRLLSPPPLPLTEQEITLLFSPGSAWRRYLVEKWETHTLTTWEEKLARLSPPWELLSELPEAEKALQYHWQKALHRIRKALYRHLFQKHATALARLSTWQNQIEPSGQTQERHLNIHAIATDLETLRSYIHQFLNGTFIPGAWDWLMAPDAAFLQETG